MPLPVPIMMPALGLGDRVALVDSLLTAGSVVLVVALFASLGLWLFFPQGDGQP